MTMAAKMLYRPVGILVGMAGGALASAVFRKVWKATGHDNDVPQPMDEHRTWREVLPAAALQGAIFALVKAAVDRGGATGVRRLTGTWPG
ncbi:DUF4235 domain-containing protein [Streptomyces sp. 549]|uniref:DUF4235 domain-containing protein n=1 Tax=Streptomyces sp. 549 TaxID=3049076 RepID=UPI0024C2231D|nr:DUF4235 domain-containing protein [Streptomyces sp. 549]MDK1474805.1 DUF4235 domain-containing protein [Streptomyces sp. 549]